MWTGGLLYIFVAHPQQTGDYSWPATRDRELGTRRCSRERGSGRIWEAWRHPRAGITAVLRKQIQAPNRLDIPSGYPTCVRGRRRCRGERNHRESWDVVRQARAGQRAIFIRDSPSVGREIRDFVCAIGGNFASRARSAGVDAGLGRRRWGCLSREAHVLSGRSAQSGSGRDPGQWGMPRGALRCIDPGAASHSWTV